LGTIRIGCSGWVYDHWRGRIYPDGLPQRRWLEHYAGVFDTVEVNNTFYRLPQLKAVERWVEETPRRFTFAIKASRYLTHVKRLRELGPGAARLMEGLTPLVASGRLGPILWQLPQSFERDDERLAGALEALPSGRHCFEFRHPSWFAADVYALLRERGAALVIADHPERPFQERELTAGWTYVRFHYGRGGRSGGYAPRELDTWRRRIAAWRARVEVYAYFNNDWQAFAPRDARRLAGGLSP
jgi:uncharacterized protein YecE (DUF72 family)